MRPALIESLESRRLLSTSSLRIVAWNVEADVNGDIVPNAGVQTVLAGINDEVINGSAHPIDILALEETTDNTDTVQPIVDDLNSIGGGTYAMSSLQGTEYGGNPGTGNGPSALIYNTSTLTLLNSVGVGTPDGPTNGEYRQVLRYEFQPIGGVASTDFYIYVIHAKSGSTATDIIDRGEEATIVRANEATLPTGSRVMYVGDLNDSVVADAGFANLNASGEGQGIDPENQNDTDPGTTPAASLLTESSTDIQYRDDYQLMTANVLYDTPDGLSYVNGSYHAFGNNGSIASGGNLTTTANTALAGLTNRTAVIAALATASDHLPIVSDFTDGVPTPIPGLSHTIVAWDMANQTKSGKQLLAPNKSNPDIAVTEKLARGSGVDAIVNAPANAWGGTHWGDTAADGSSRHETINFAVTADTGTTLSLSSLNLNYRTDSNGPTELRVQYQLHGGTWTSISTVDLLSYDKHGSFISPVNLTSVAALQNLAQDSVVNFRLIPYGSTSVNAAFYIYNERGSDLELDGTVASLT